MTIDQIAVRLAEIRSLGFVPTMRAGNTGIGYTLETLFGIAENNIRTPDFGEIELKSQRQNVTTPITLFTFNRGAWHVKQSEVIKTFGYVDEDGRQALYCFVTSKPNNQGLFTVTNETALQLYHTRGVLIASWSIEMILQRFAERWKRLLSYQPKRAWMKTYEKNFGLMKRIFAHAEP
jgi:hypothetical protein